jgi:hypothetical protein
MSGEQGQRGLGGRLPYMQRKEPGMVTPGRRTRSSAIIGRVLGLLLAVYGLWRLVTALTTFGDLWSVPEPHVEGDLGWLLTLGSLPWSTVAHVWAADTVVRRGAILAVGAMLALQNGRHLRIATAVLAAAMVPELLFVPGYLAMAVGHARYAASSIGLQQSATVVHGAMRLGGVVALIWAVLHVTFVLWLWRESGKIDAAR